MARELLIYTCWWRSPRFQRVYKQRLPQGNIPNQMQTQRLRAGRPTCADSVRSVARLSNLGFHGKKRKGGMTKTRVAENQHMYKLHPIAIAVLPRNKRKQIVRAWALSLSRMTFEQQMTMLSLTGLLPTDEEQLTSMNNAELMELALVMEARKLNCSIGDILKMALSN